MALDALCGMTQRSFRLERNQRRLCNGLPAVEDFEREFETLQLADNGEVDPMHVPRPPFVS